MSTNGVNVCEDAEMDCDGEKVVTMMDVLKEQEDFEEDANAVLGASDDKNCTYSKGYIKRQAIYACMTCIDTKNDPTKWAGICLACSLTCHENHELIELYTKRNFRCDCGNPKFNSHPCQFTASKTDLNFDNIYNQNFGGVYCICHRPYPDPESDTQGDMIQCIICEDWLHSNHLDAVVPSNEQYSEMICKSCMDKNEFLHDYSDLAVNKENMDVDILNTSSEATITTAICNSNTEKTESYVVASTNSNEIINGEQTTKVKTNNAESKTSGTQDSLNGEKTNITTPDNVVTSDSNVSVSEEVCDSEQENLISTEKEKIAEEMEESGDNRSEKQNRTKETATPATKTDTTDNRSQEQVDEDLLLADPMETNLDQKNVNVIDVAPTKEIQSNTDEISAETKSEPQEMDMSVSISETEKTEVKVDLSKESKPNTESNTEQSLGPDNAEDSNIVTTTETSDSLAVEENSANIVATKELENASVQFAGDTPSEFSQNETKLVDYNGKSPNFAENSKKLQTNEETDENVASAEQSRTSPISEQLEDIPTKTENEFTDKSNPVSTIKPMDNEGTLEDQHNINTNKEKDISVEEDKTDNSTDVVIHENTINDATNNEIQNIKDVSSYCVNELPNKIIDTDILKRKLSSDGNIENVDIKKKKLEQSQCVRPREIKKVYHGATFWPSNFRHKLCTCSECISMYKDLSVLFLIDPEDTVTAYEMLGKEKTDGKPASQYEKGMAALSSLGRVQQINALTEYAKLRDKLLDFLKTFKDKKVIVKEEDIKAFFAGMKPVREPDGVYFCR